MVDEPTGLRILEAAFHGAQELRPLHEGVVLLWREEDSRCFPVLRYDDRSIIGSHTVDDLGGVGLEGGEGKYIGR